jgi:lantibiotic modifying enzyme
VNASDTALAIARGLVADALWHGERCTWVGPVPEMLSGRVVTAVRSLAPDLYGGTAGVGLALSEIAAATGDAGCRRTAVAALRQSLARAQDVDPRLRLGLFTGLPGISVAAVRAGLILDECELVHRGRALAQGLRPSDDDRAAHDLISGRAGAVIALLDVARALGEDDLVERAVEFGQDLLAAAADHQSWSWAHEGPGTGVSPTGIGHGVSGVACALLELWSHTGDWHFRRAADGALTEEQTRFDPKLGNWRRAEDDSRSHVAGTTAQEAFVTWCHGAPGIGLSRLHAWELTFDETRRAEMDAAVRVTAAWVRAALETGRGGFSLCHGVAGNAEMLRTCARACQSASAAMLQLADDVVEWGIAECAVRRRPWPGVDSPSLMTGVAGIARFYLGAHEPGIGSLLLPRHFTVSSQRADSWGAT